MATIFSKIISGEIPCHKILEDEDHLAFLDIRPICEGHTLVIPKKEIDYFFDLDDKMMAELMCFSKIVARMIKRAIPCRKIGVMICGIEVPHVHVHLAPVNAVSDMSFALAHEVDNKILAQTAEKIRNS